MRGLRVRSFVLLVTLAVVFVLAFDVVRHQYWLRFAPEKALAHALKGVDRIRVRSGGTCHREEESEKTLFEERDPATIVSIIANIDVVEEENRVRCACCGNPSLEFYKGERLILTVGCHHGKRLRWQEGWPGDALLTTESAQVLNDWLGEHGVVPH